MMKQLVLMICLMYSHLSFSNVIMTDTETRNPSGVCGNVEMLVYLLSPYIDVDLVGCKKEHIDTSLLGNKTFNVQIEVKSSVSKCKSEDNQAIIFDIPTNTYLHWNPPVRFDYLDKIINDLGLTTEIIVRNISENRAPFYKQIVLIPECAFKK